jgi:hypothetical protein
MVGPRPSRMAIDHWVEGLRAGLSSSARLGRHYGHSPLVAALQRRHRDRSSKALLGAPVDEVRSFSPEEQQDAPTLIVARRRNAATRAEA